MSLTLFFMWTFREKKLVFFFIFTYYILLVKWYSHALIFGFWSVIKKVQYLLFIWYCMLFNVMFRFLIIIFSCEFFAKRTEGCAAWYIGPGKNKIYCSQNQGNVTVRGWDGGGFVDKKRFRQTPLSIFGFNVESSFFKKYCIIL